VRKISLQGAFYPTVLTLARFFICRENIVGYRKLWLKSSHKYSVAQVDTYPTVTNAVMIITSFSYGWTFDELQLCSPIVYFSLTVCFFAAMNLAIWDGVPFGLKWASFYLTGFAQGSGPIFLTMVNEACVADQLERKFILGTTNSVAYAFNAVRIFKCHSKSGRIDSSAYCQHDIEE
jgi:ACS family pantothenate transporter-like MFS transporter